MIKQADNKSWLPFQKTGRELQMDEERRSDWDRWERVENPHWDPARVKSDLGQLICASTRTGTDVFFGLTQVLRNLLGNFKSASPAGGPRYRPRSESYRDDSEYRAAPRSRPGFVSDNVEEVRSAVRQAARAAARSKQKSSASKELSG